MHFRFRSVLRARLTVYKARGGIYRRQQRFRLGLTRKSAEEMDKREAQGKHVIIIHLEISRHLLAIKRFYLLQRHN